MIRQKNQAEVEVKVEKNNSPGYHSGTPEPGVNVVRCISISIHSCITLLFRAVEQVHTYRALALQEKIPALTQSVSNVRYHGDRGSEGQ